MILRTAPHLNLNLTLFDQYYPHNRRVSIAARTPKTTPAMGTTTAITAVPMMRQLIKSKTWTH